MYKNNKTETSKKIKQWKLKKNSKRKIWKVIFFSEERLYSNKPIFIYLIAQLVNSFRHYKKIENKISQFCNQFLQFTLPTSSLLLILYIIMLYLVLLRRDRTIIRLISSCIRWWKGLQAFFVTTMPKKIHTATPKITTHTSQHKFKRWYVSNFFE